MTGDPFVAHRSLLFTVAYETLGSAADAEDVLQESWLRWAGVEHSQVRDPRSYLIRVVTRQALNRLRTLSRRDLHGYGIVQFIQQSSDNELLVEEGSLYPALQRLELNRWIEGVWGVTSNNRRARIYKITAAGRKQLTVEARKYAKLTLAIARVMGAQ